MSDSGSWVCGDCETEYSADVQFCENRELDHKMINKWNQGRLVGEASMRRELGDPVKELANAIRVVSKYGFAVVDITKRGE